MIAKKSQPVMNNTNNMGNQLVNILKGILVKPIDTIKETAKDTNFGLAMIIMGILSVITGLFAMSILKNAASMILSNMSYGLYSYSSVSVELPYLETFLGAAVLMFAMSFIYTGLLYLVNSVMFKGEKNFKKIYAMYASVSVITIISVLLATILLFVNVTVGLIVFIIGSLLSMVYTYHGLKFIGPKDENKYGYIYLITTIFLYIVLFIIIKIFS